MKKLGRMGYSSLSYFSTFMFFWLSALVCLAGYNKNQLMVLREIGFLLATSIMLLMTLVVCKHQYILVCLLYGVVWLGVRYTFISFFSVGVLCCRYLCIMFALVLLMFLLGCLKLVVCLLIYFLKFRFSYHYEFALWYALGMQESSSLICLFFIAYLFCHCTSFIAGQRLSCWASLWWRVGNGLVLSGAYCEVNGIRAKPSFLQQCSVRYYLTLWEFYI